MSANLANILGIARSGDMFKDEKELMQSKFPKFHDIPIELIDDFPDHPFKVRDDDDMKELVDSIKERGLITPVTLRPKDDGRYEIVSGHRRKRACEIAGLSTVKADVREMSRDEAIILMVDSNLQRTTILPSEKAFSYKMRLEAMKRQGQRTDLTSRPVGDKLDERRAGEVLGEAVGESERQVQRYIRLTELDHELLDRVDDNQIALRPAVELSYLSQEEQKLVNEKINELDCTPSHDQAIRMRKSSESGELTAKKIEEIMHEEKPNQKEKVHISLVKVQQFVPGMTIDKAEEYILQALEFYQKYGQTMAAQTHNNIQKTR